ncbi:GNAT family N-acetyltransferase [Thetidibacter halocola]|uniref:N-acetyltransferase n=1 Tax=Thetidibacter halocola TaxID=2827239 RepID=A0A8J7WCW2_9RHOB|nr:N-acetyltransferase [Thetidibacter halocola]MBS0125260.1 N-acetyltransferase [Thetidibacter halocola]
MQFSDAFKDRERQIADLVTASFTASEGAGEGALVGGLVRSQMASTPPQDLHIFLAEEDGALLGVAVFTRLRYAADPRRVFLLSPLAVATDRQGEGIGQALLQHALGVLHKNGVHVAMTYGNPAFYGKVGFVPLSESTAAAPLPLSHPEGWIGQSLTGAALTPLRGPCTCVPALNDPRFW